jgi:hypothetical protein
MVLVDQHVASLFIDNALRIPIRDAVKQPLNMRPSLCIRGQAVATPFLPRRKPSPL